MESLQINLDRLPSKIADMVALKLAEKQEKIQSQSSPSWQRSQLFLPCKYSYSSALTFVTQFKNSYLYIINIHICLQFITNSLYYSYYSSRRQKNQCSKYTAVTQQWFLLTEYRFESRDQIFRRSDLRASCFLRVEPLKSRKKRETNHLWTESRHNTALKMPLPEWRMKMKPQELRPCFPKIYSLFLRRRLQNAKDLFGEI